MEINNLSEYSYEQIDTLLKGVSFFKELQLEGRRQLNDLLSLAYIINLEQGETIMRRGESGSWLYFLTKGRLAVYLDSAKRGNPLNYITPGELFGDLALLCGHERKATVAADKSSQPAVLLAIDFKPFGDLLNFKVINMQTKLIFYRAMVHSIRWRLEVSRMDNPCHSLATEMRQAPTYTGEKDSVRELESLHKQAQYLANVLDRWNSFTGNVGDVVPITEPSEKDANIFLNIAENQALI